MTATITASPTEIVDLGGPHPASLAYEYRMRAWRVASQPWEGSCPVKDLEGFCFVEDESVLAESHLDDFCFEEDLETPPPPGARVGAFVLFGEESN